MLIDPDVLEEHNLENQVFDAGDIGKTKVAALRQRIAAIDPTIDVQTWTGRIEDYKGPWMPVVFGCLDNVAARHYISYRTIVEGGTLIDGGIEGFRGAVKTIVAKKTACQACYPMLPRAAPKASCSQDPIPSTYVTAAVIANLQVSQLIKLVHQHALRSYVAVDLAKGTWHNSDFEPNPECEICGASP
jgi:molybdopterin/thiamine biosynthesis adenylyltransferase